MKALVIIPARTHIDPKLDEVLRAVGVPFMPAYEMSDLPLARSQLVSQALASGAERVLFVDSDVVPRVDQLRRLADTELVTPARALFGIYALRNGRLSVCPRGAAEGERFDIAYGGLGFAAVHRASLERVGERLPTIDGPVRWKPYCVPFVAVAEGKGTYYADDRSLCQRLVDAGTALVADRELVVGHRVPGVVLPEVP